MTDVSLTTVLGFVFTILGVFSGVVIWAVRVMLDSRVKPIADEQIRLDKEQQRIDKEFLKFQATLPEKYVTREDWIRQINVIDAKQDTLSERQARANDLLVRVDANMKLIMEKKNG